MSNEFEGCNFSGQRVCSEHVNDVRRAGGSVGMVCKKCRNGMEHGSHVLSV